MSTLILPLILLAPPDSTMQIWLEHAFYPGLFLVLALASLGLPIPEDAPLIAAGVLLHTHPGAASWLATLIVALAGVMTGDVILYTLGRRWGHDVVSHRSVKWLITPRRFRKATAHFRRYGVWFCFFGRFFMGIRAVMCLTAGATRFRLWLFLTADLCGAVISVPFFVWLGYWFTGVIPRLEAYVTGIQWIILGIAVVVVTVFVSWKLHRRRARKAESDVDSLDVPSPEGPSVTLPPPSTSRAAEKTVPIETES